MRYVMVFLGNPAFNTYHDGTPMPDGPVEMTPATKVQVVNWGPQAWRLQVDNARLGTLSAFFRDREDERVGMLEIPLSGSFLNPIYPQKGDTILRNGR